MAMAAKPEADKNANFLESRQSLQLNDAIVNTDEALTAEFRIRLGMLEEDEDLSEVFKASIGISGPEAMPEMTEVDIEVEKQYEATLKTFKFDKFCKKNFKDNQTSQFSKEPLRMPLLSKKEEIDKLISPLLWLAVQRFMGDLQQPEATDTQKSKIPMMTKIFHALELHSKQRKSGSSSSNDTVVEDEKEFVSFKSGNKGTVSEKRNTWKRLFAKQVPEKRLARCNSTSKSPDISYPTELSSMQEAIPTEELDLIHYIIGHAILRRDLRDEVFCQVCKQLRSNTDKRSCAQGWVLLALCAGCFLPSDQVQ